jgi:hypothetical protein
MAAATISSSPVLALPLLLYKGQQSPSPSRSPSSLSKPSRARRREACRLTALPEPHPSRRTTALGTPPRSSPCSCRAQLALAAVRCGHLRRCPHWSSLTQHPGDRAHAVRQSSAVRGASSEFAPRHPNASPELRRRRDRAAHQLDHLRPTSSLVRADFARPWSCIVSPRPNPSIHHKVEDNPNIFISPKSCFELIHEFDNYSL